MVRLSLSWISESILLWFPCHFSTSIWISNVAFLLVHGGKTAFSVSNTPSLQVYGTFFNDKLSIKLQKKNAVQIPSLFKISHLCTNICDDIMWRRILNFFHIYIFLSLSITHKQARTDTGITYFSFMWGPPEFGQIK